jgi:ATP-dependent DNA helicase RecQ
LPAPEQILKAYWGFDTFRPLQKEIITAVLAQKDVLALLPTGGGKSVCYQLPALMQEGCCLVVSPLIALMQDQVKRLKELDISAAYLSAGMHFKELERTLQNAIHGGYKLLYVSPERLQSSYFKEYLPALPVNLIAIDEAHCISQWGHDFRPDYLKINELREELPDVPMLALTATATTEVAQDIISQLDLRNTEVFRQSFKRDNIFYSVRYSENKTGDVVKVLEKEKGSAIVYCRSRRQTETLTKHLKDFGIDAYAYHAGMAKAKREEMQNTWMKSREAVMVATTAFGMGIDKPDVRLVLHYDAPEHPEAYYQEAGRAGRDGKSSIAVSLFNHSDMKRLEENINLYFPPEAYLRQVYQSVCEYLQIPISAAPERYFPFDLVDFCKKFDLQPLAASCALKTLEREDLWTITEAAFQPTTIKIIVDRAELDELHSSAPHLALITTAMLRLYGSLFYYPTPVRVSAIAKQAKLQPAEALQCLLLLEKMNMIEYQQPTEGAQLYFHHTRVDSKHLLIDIERLRMLKKRQQERTDQMIAFLEDKDICRERLLLKYFGENENKDCNHCDICLSKIRPREKDLKQQILELVEESPSLHELTAAFDEQYKEDVISCLRLLTDQGRIVRNTDGRFLLKQNQQF